MVPLIAIISPILSLCKSIQKHIKVLKHIQQQAANTSSDLPGSEGKSRWIETIKGEGIDGKGNGRDKQKGS